MGDQEVRRVIDRALAEPGFLERLRQSPETVLATFTLSPEELATFLKALRESRGGPASQTANAIRVHFLDRRST
jgi:hypothetical protein